MEPMTLLDKEFSKRKNLIDLVRIIATNYVCDWEVLPFDCLSRFEDWLSRFEEDL